MKIPVKTLKSGFSMPVFGLGTWLMGGGHDSDPDNDDEADQKAIENAIEAGITHIDTAEMYAGGHAEELVSNVIGNYDRSKLFIVSKVWPNHLSHDDVILSCKKSLKRLKTDYLDLYLIHAPNPDIPVSQTMKAMDVLLKNGLIRNIGASNFSVESLRRAQNETQNKIVCDQLHYNLMIREVEKRGLLEFCQKNDIFLTAWRPVQKGIFAKKNFELLNEMATKYNKSEIQIAINWLISQDNVVTISKMRDPKHLRENIGSVGWQMEKDDIERLRKDFPEQYNSSDATSISII